MNKETWLDKLEAKHPNWALDGLMRYIALLMLLIFILNKTGILSYNMLFLNSQLVLQGQIWRLFTFLLIPVSENPFFLLFELLISIMCADGIESVMGSFKLTMYYIFGAVFIIIASFIFPGGIFNSYYLYLTLFFGYATLFPNQELLLMFIIPIKIKYIAFFSCILMVFNFLTASVYGKTTLILAVANYILFFAIPALKGIKYDLAQRKRRNAFEKAATQELKAYRHKCSVCGKTDISDPELQFRYCTCKECGNDGVPFCLEHLKEHKAKKREENP